MKDEPSVFEVVPTKNSWKTIGNFLESIKNQTYTVLATTVVDSFSSDKTKESSIEQNAKVVERDAMGFNERNNGIQLFTGRVVLCKDSEMELMGEVAEECVKSFRLDEKIKGMILPAKSIGNNFLIRVRDFERHFYVDTEVNPLDFLKRRSLRKLVSFNEY